ncbi:MAG: BatA domain-containing protein [Puniceicoccales bacterium]|jgi:hypothetical protein|nr:BatA domain-containing protein [Puniceicoccales bacterium]
MTFLNPWMLAALAAIAAPVLIHLFSKPQLKRIRWAATRFLLASVEKNRRKLQIEDLLLLLLRALLIALLVLIFARPALLSPPDALTLSSEETTAAILLDNSASMGQSDGTKTRFEQARAGAQDVLAKLHPGSTCALYLAGAQTTQLVSKPTQDFALLRRLLDNAAPSDFSSDLFPALKAAADTLSPAQGRKEIFIFTDNQALAWKQLGNIRKLQEQHRDTIRFRYFILGGDGEDNLAITALKTLDGTAAAGQPLRCIIEVTNHGKTIAEKISVRIAVDDEAPQDETLLPRIEPGETKAVNLFVRIRRAGYHTLRATIPGDRLPADNQRAIALRVVEQLKTLVIDGSPAANPAARDGFFLRHALVPVPPGQAAHYYLKTALGTPGMLGSASLHQYQAIFLANVASLPRAASENLARYVATGGSLIIFPGNAANPGFYNSDPVFAPLLPARLLPAREAPAPQKFLTWQTRDYTHPVVSLWNDTAAGTLAAVRVSRYYPLELKPRTGDTATGVLLKYANNEIAAAHTESTATRGHPRGRVVLFGIPATTDWSNFPVSSAFVPLITRTLAYATNTTDPRRINLTPGQPFALEVPAEYEGRDIAVQRIGATGTAARPQITGRVERLGNTAWVRYKDTTLAGAYAVYLGDATTPQLAFAVQADPEESALKTQPAADIAPLLDMLPSGISAGSTAKENIAVDADKPGTELWFYLAIAALVFALTETGFAHYCSRAR